MYDIENKYLYEILDDYKEVSSSKEKDEILDEFMKLLWSSKNKRRIFQRDIKFCVLKSWLETEIGQILNTYSVMSYTSYRSMSKDTDFVSLLRQKINNIYTNLCDGRVCLKKEYMDLIKFPKQTYYRWKAGEEFDATALVSQIDENLAKLESVKEKYAKQKMNISWNVYKELIRGYFKRMFENYIPLEYFEDKSMLTIDIDTWSEDNFAIAYFCKGLDGYMRNYQKKYYGLYVLSNKDNVKHKRCLNCGNMFIVHNKCDYSSKYCNVCKAMKKKEKYIKYNKTRVTTKLKQL